MFEISQEPCLKNTRIDISVKVNQWRFQMAPLAAPEGLIVLDPTTMGVLSVLDCANKRQREEKASISFPHSPSPLRSLLLGRIHDLTKGGSDKRPPKAVAPRGVPGVRKIFNFRASEMRFPAFLGAI